MLGGELDARWKRKRGDTGKVMGRSDDVILLSVMRWQ